MHRLAGPGPAGVRAHRRSGVRVASHELVVIAARRPRQMLDGRTVRPPEADLSSR
jgi:hypothetical protein